MTTLKLRFDADLQFQRDAMNAVTSLFTGQPLAESSFSVSYSAGPLALNEYGSGNQLVLDTRTLLANLRDVQQANELPQLPPMLPGLEPESLDVAIEMETGTGKTYVYLRTLFELNKTYGFTKFVIVVPSIAIREGVLHSIAIMKEHFLSLYSTPFDHFVYDSKHLGKLRGFATANCMQIMVINIQAFQRDVQEGGRAGAANIIYTERDTLSGHRPIDFLSSTRPIVVVDEPQKMTGDASTAAITRLDPLAILRYSATYESQSKIYRLGPIEAYQQRLVKQIEVASVQEDDNFNEAFVRLEKTDAAKQNAVVTITVDTGPDVKHKKVTIKHRDDLYVKSGDRAEYRNGFIVSEISFEPGNEYVLFGGGLRVTPDQALGSLSDDIMRVQIRETVKEHVDKERKLRPKGIKVLSLFFIDKVANYRVYNDDGSWTLGKIGLWFEEALREVNADPYYTKLITDPVEKVHDGYFSQDRKGQYRDTSGETADDQGAYELIMKDKERLLSMDEPLRFIFSHSALREGWDNPNIFQICTLNETKSTARKRQEIGRGLRLPVNQEGERIHDETVNRLTVIANESYKGFAEALQTEYEQDCNVRFGVVPPEAFAKIRNDRDGAEWIVGQKQSAEIWTNLKDAGYIGANGRIEPKFDPKNPLLFGKELPEAIQPIRNEIFDAISQYTFRDRIIRQRAKQQITFNKQIALDEGFQSLWERISKKTRYRVSLDTAELVGLAVNRIKSAEAIHPVRISTDYRTVDVTQAGVAAGLSRKVGDDEVTMQPVIPDVLTYLQNETDLTRRTIARILIESGRADDLRVNPQAFLTLAKREIDAAMKSLMLKGIRYEQIDGISWEMHTLEEEAEKELTRYIDKLYKVKHREKTPFDYIEWQSSVEQQFAAELDANEDVRCFIKLPNWFKVDTPLGPYNPDWAILYTNGATRLYLVRETKGSLIQESLRESEKQKIDCGRKHFRAIGVDYNVTTSLGETIRAL